VTPLRWFSPSSSDSALGRWSDRPARRRDAAIAAVAAAGKSSQVAVISGEYGPAWVTAACPDMKVVTSKGDATIAIPVTSCFAAPLGQMIAAVGAHYNANADVVSIQSDGLGARRDDDG
jgi:hypothetical protein